MRSTVRACIAFEQRRAHSHGYDRPTRRHASVLKIRDLCLPCSGRVLGRMRPAKGWSILLAPMAGACLLLAQSCPGVPAPGYPRHSSLQKWDCVPRSSTTTIAVCCRLQCALAISTPGVTHLGWTALASRQPPEFTHGFTILDTYGRVLRASIRRTPWPLRNRSRPIHVSQHTANAHAHCTASLAGPSLCCCVRTHVQSLQVAPDCGSTRC